MNKKLPDGWKAVRLGEVCDCFDNKRIPLSDEIRRKKQGIYPYCGANGIVDYIDEYIFDDELILLAEDGGNFNDFETKSIAYLMRGKFWVNNHAHIVKAKKDYYNLYIFYCLKHKDIRAHLSGGTRQKLNKSELEKIEIILPPLPIQQRIAAILSKADEEVRLHKAITKKLEERNKGLAQRLLSGEIDLSGFNF